MDDDVVIKKRWVMRHSEQMRKQSRHDQNTVEYGLTAEQASRQSTVLDSKSYIILSGTILGENKAWDFIDLCSMTSEDSNRWKVSQTIFVSSVSLGKACLGSRPRCRLPYSCIWSQIHDHSFFFHCLVFPGSHLTLSFSHSLSSPSFPSWYACVTADLQSRWRSICLYLANFKTGLTLEDVLLNEVLYLQCHGSVPSKLFTLMNADCDLMWLTLYAVGAGRYFCGLLHSIAEGWITGEDVTCRSAVGVDGDSLGPEALLLGSWLIRRWVSAGGYC